MIINPNDISPMPTHTFPEQYIVNVDQTDQLLEMLRALFPDYIFDKWNLAVKGSGAGTLKYWKEEWECAKFIHWFELLTRLVDDNVIDVNNWGSYLPHNTHPIEVMYFMWKRNNLMILD